MNPRLLRPKASGGPVFTTQGYARVWGVTTKSSGNVTGTAETDTGYYAVKWWDNTTTVYDSGDTFSKAAAGNQRAFEVYPCDSGGVASGQFDGFDISNNALTRVRSEDVTLADEVAAYFNWSNWTYVSGSPAESAILSGNLLSAAALDEFYTDLDAGGGDIYVSGNPGIDADDPTIATAKGYTVFGSVPPSTALLLNFNGTNGSTTFTDSSPNGLTVTVGGNAAISTTEKKFGSGSGAFSISGNDDYITVEHNANFTFDASDLFTVECWYYPTSWTAYSWIVSKGGDFDGTGREWAFGVGDGAILAYRQTGGDVMYSASASISLNQWVHLAWSHDGRTLRLFVDGVLAGQTVWGTQNGIGGDNGRVWVGKFLDYVGIQHDAPGYIDDLRIVKEAALYTANFTPPAAQLGVYP